MVMFSLPRATSNAALLVDTLTFDTHQFYSFYKIILVALNVYEIYFISVKRCPFLFAPSRRERWMRLCFSYSDSCFFSTRSVLFSWRQISGNRSVRFPPTSAKSKITNVNPFERCPSLAIEESRFQFWSASRNCIPRSHSRGGKN